LPDGPLILPGRATIRVSSPSSKNIPLTAKAIGLAHFVLVEISGAIWMQIVVSIVGILMMTALAYYRSWSKNADKAPTKIKPIVAAAG
jgi:hypothetical protein